MQSWTLIPGEGPFGRGPGVSSGRSPEPAGGTEQTGKGRAEGRPQGGPQTTECTATGKGVPQYRRRNQRRATGGTATIFLGGRVNTTAIKPAPQRPGSRIAERGSVSVKYKCVIINYP